METSVEPSLTPESHAVDVNGLRLHYVDWGNPSAPPLVLLHGHGSNVHTFDQLADRLRHDWRIIALDQRGHGDSDWADDYAGEHFVADFAGFASAVGLERFSLLGHSMGGLVAMAYAATNPGAVERLVIVDIGPEVGREGAESVRRQTVEAPEEFDTLEDVYAFLRASDPEPPDDMLRYRAKHGARQLENGRWGWKYDRALRSPSGESRLPDPELLWAALASIPCPTLVVRGERSQVLDAAVAERMERTLPRGRRVEVENAGHRITLDNLDGLEREVRAFLAEP